MNILLTGSDGFIGSHLFHQLKEEHNVIGFDIKNGHDILNSELPKDIDLVIHLAGLSGVKDSSKDLVVIVPSMSKQPLNHMVY